MAIRAGRSLVVFCGACALALSGCGRSDDRPPSGPTNAIDAMHAITGEFAQNAEFGCVVQPTIGTVKAIVRDRELAEQIRAVAPNLYRSGRLTIAVDPTAVPDRARLQAFRALRRSVMDPLVVNLTDDLHVKQCPRVSIDVPSRYRIVGPTKQFVDHARRSYGNIVIVRRVSNHAA